MEPLSLPIGGSRRSDHSSHGVGVPLHSGAPHARAATDVRLPHTKSQSAAVVAVSSQSGQISLGVVGLGSTRAIHARRIMRIKMNSSMLKS